jgi:prepilin-type N-terminal cleavage/methylation domain-containing protein
MRFVKKPNGFSLIEVIVTLVIVAILTTVFVATLAGSKQGDKIDRATQMIYDDLILIRSRAVSTNADHRLSFSSATAWAIQQYNPATTSWVNVGAPRTMPSDTWLTSTAFTNAGSNLAATPRGLFTFASGATGNPYVTIAGFGTSRTKSVNVFLGGALDVQTP